MKKAIVNARRCFLPLLLGVSALLVSCQTTASENGENTPTRLDLSFQESAPALRPDSASWKLGGDGDRAPLTQEVDHPERFHARVDLTRALGRDTVSLSIWRYGLRTAVLPYAGSGPGLVAERVTRDQLARDLLVRHQTKTTSDAKAYPADASGVRRVYAECLLSREGMCPDSPPVRPVGMDSTALIDEMCRELARRGKSFNAQIQGPFYGWTQTKWRDVVVGRVRSGVLTSRDSAILFPVEMVVRQKSSIGQVVRSGGAAVPMSGRFYWNTAKQVQTFLEIRTLQGKIADGFQSVLPQPDIADTSISLDGRSNLRALGSVPAGAYQRTVGVRDADGLVASWVDTFQVMAADTARMTPVHGASTRTVAYDSSKVWVAWKGDPTRMDSVWIDGLLTFPRDSVWGIWVQPPPGGKTVVELRARTRDGILIEDRAEVYREPRQQVRDSLPPRILQGPSSIEYVGDSLRVTSTWVVTDDVLVDSVRIEGAPVPAVGNTYTRTVMVDSSKRSIRIDAVDPSGNRSFDTLILRRSPDLVKPVVAATSTTLSRTVSADSVSTLVAWRVTDDRLLKTVWIDDSVVVGQGGIYASQRVLAMGSNVIRIKAMDAAGNMATDSVVVVRESQTGPRLVRVSPHGSDTTVFESTDSLDAAWDVFDPAGLAAVLIEGRSVGGVGDRYSARRAVAYGKSRVHIRAVNKSGKASIDSFLVERIDRIAPKLSHQGPWIDSVVDGSMDSMVVAWKAEDNWGVKRLEIDRVAVTGASDVYSRKVALAYGWNILRIMATDSAGNTAQDSIKVYRTNKQGLRLYRDLPVFSDTVVAQAVAKIPVAYFATSPVSVDTVLIGNSFVVRDSTGEFRIEMPLAIGMNAIPVLAVDHDGNRKVDTVKVRRKDQTPPILVRQSGTTDSTVDSTQRSVTVAWKASDNVGIKQVRINGILVNSTTGIYPMTFNLGYGVNYFTVVAFDSAGNATADTVRFTRPSPIVSAPSHFVSHLALLESREIPGILGENRRVLTWIGAAKREELS